MSFKRTIYAQLKPNDNIKGRLDKYIVDEEGFAQKTEFRNQEIERLEKSKEGKTESEISSINSKIYFHKEFINGMKTDIVIFKCR